MSQYRLVGGDGSPEKITNESLGLVGGGDGGLHGSGLHGDEEPEKATNKSLGLVNGSGGRSCGSVEPEKATNETLRLIGGGGGLHRKSYSRL